MPECASTPAAPATGRTAPWSAAGWLRPPCTRKKGFNKIMGYRDLWALESILSGTQSAIRQIFKTRFGRPINSNYLARRFKHLLREAGLATMRLVDLRHTAATLALAAGVSVKVVSEQPGHASSAFTLDVYAHVLPHMRAEAAVRVEAFWGMDGHQEEGTQAGRRKPPEPVPENLSPKRSDASLPEPADQSTN